MKKWKKRKMKMKKDNISVMLVDRALVSAGRVRQGKETSCKEYISNYRKLATKTVYLQHEQQHEQ